MPHDFYHFLEIAHRFGADCFDNPKVRTIMVR